MLIKISIFLAFLLTLAWGRSLGSELKKGDIAPDFMLPGSDGKTYSLKEFKGKQAVVIAWFPKAFTGGWTAECKSFRENGPALRDFNVAYFTASCDTPEENQRFAESLDLDYPILSDPGKGVARAFGVVHKDRNLPERWTFYIGKDGLILYVDRQVRAATAAKDVIAKLKDLNVE